MNEVWICAAKRTAVGAFQGSLKDISAADLGAKVLQAILREKGIDPLAIEEVIAGNVLQAGQGMNPARQVALKAGLPASSTALTVNRVCGSGLQAVVNGAQEVLLGEVGLVVAGGIENMSRCPYYLLKARAGLRLGNDTIVDGIIQDGLWDVFTDVHMGITAENLASKYGISREEQDTFALTSQSKAAAAIEAGRFQDEIVPVEVSQGKGLTIRFQVDEFVRADSSLEKLAKLRPAFKKDGTVTAGNASGINDGAAFLLLASPGLAKRLAVKPMARILGWGVGGVEPAEMGLGPVPAVRKLLQRTGLRLEDMDLLEINEAFAAQSLAVMRELELRPDKVNPNGGAIAIGHPIGASGARILVTLLHELSRRKAKFGLAALCIGGGQGIALAVERMD